MSRIPHPGRDVGCSCPTTAQLARLTFAGVEREPCKVHDQAEIKRRADDAEREHWRAEARRLRGNLDQMKADAAALLPDCCCLSPKDALALAFRTGENPPPCPVHDVEQTIDAGIALNDARALSERSGFPLATE